jgi:hypothetical protein
MDVFNLDRALLSDYQHFNRSFTITRSADIRDQIDGIYVRVRKALAGPAHLYQSSL